MRKKIIFLLIVVLIGVLHVGLEIVVRRNLALGSVSFMDDKPMGGSPESSQRQRMFPAEFKPPPVQPMNEIDVLDQDADSWTTIFGSYHSGLVVFDANSDGRLDLYFCQDGQNWTRPTDTAGVLQDQPVFQHNGLYLNMGNTTKGVPRFIQISELVRSNDTYVAEELVVENFLFPRQSAGDDVRRRGRKSIVAAAADFNGDGLPDLYVGNTLPGMPWSHPKTQRILPPFVSPIGRSVKHVKQPLVALGKYFVQHRVQHDGKEVHESGRGSEPVGANSLFINLGDRDHDGIPEWRDSTHESGVGGQRSTYSIAVADIDLDGDLDIYEGNVMDWDFWPGGAKEWAGGPNALYVNQLAETGLLSFKNKAHEMKVDEVLGNGYEMPWYTRIRRIPFLPKIYSLLFLKFESYKPGRMSLNGQQAETGQISWASLFQDVNGDGYADLWVANDMSRLMLYINQEGGGFLPETHALSENIGSWMSFAPADYNGDLEEDVFLGNLGGGFFVNGVVDPDPFTMFEPVLLSSMFFSPHYDPRHAILDGKNLRTKIECNIIHSSCLPPDSSLPDNNRPVPAQIEFDRHGLDPYEFTWGSVAFDLQNDGLLDLYFVGNMVGRSGGLFSAMTTGPGRLLVNMTPKQKSGASPSTLWIDQTAEHKLFNILELDYEAFNDAGYLYRRAPSQNWTKKDGVYSFDRSAWLHQGRGIQEHIIQQDMIQTAESGVATMAADLNNDGFSDLVLRNVGGYDSRSSKAKNLMARSKKGIVNAVPAPDHNYPPLTDFEPGSTRVFLNTHSEKNWIKVKLVDDTPNQFNRDALGARVVVNGTYLRVQRSTQGSHAANRLDALHFGLGEDVARHVEVTWPDRERTVTQVSAHQMKNQLLVISKSKGLLL